MSIELILIPVGIAVASSVSSMIEKRQGLNNTYKLQTVMRRQDLLGKAIQQYGCDIKNLDDSKSEAVIGDIKIYFTVGESGIFEAVFDESVDIEDGQEFLENIHTEYAYLIQQETCDRLLQEAESNGLEFESKELDSDRSIILTFNVNSDI